jgi:RimJ/RimL family protein N-acetyltransferase
MLQQLFSQFSRRGVKRVALAVSAENANALRVYERAGMHRSREFIEYQITIYNL